MKKQLTNEELKQRIYQESMRYMANAEALLEKAGEENDKRYVDRKYVRLACATAYNAMLDSLDGFFEINGTVLLLPEHKPKGVKGMLTKHRPRIGDYRRCARAIGEHFGDTDLLKDLNEAYSLLHLYGYYDGVLLISVIREGLNLAYAIIERMRPDTLLPQQPPRPDNPLARVLHHLAAVFGLFLR